MEQTNTKPFFAPPERKYLSSKGLRTYLKDFADLDLSQSCLYKLTMNGSIPHIKGPGNRLLFPIADIRQWVEQGAKSTES